MSKKLKILRKLLCFRLVFTYAERKFEIKSDSAEEIQKWYNQLTTLVEKLMQRNKSVSVKSNDAKGQHKLRVFMIFLSFFKKKKKNGELKTLIMTL